MSIPRNRPLAEPTPRRFLRTQRGAVLRLRPIMMTTPVATLYYCRRPCRAAGRIVLPQTRQTDHGNLCFLNPDHLFFVIARYELDAGDRSKDLNSNGRHSQ